jgi:hypothetical protein
MEPGAGAFGIEDAVLEGVGVVNMKGAAQRMVRNLP